MKTLLKTPYPHYDTPQTLNKTLQAQRSTNVRYTLNATVLQNVTWALFNATYLPYVQLPTNASG